MAITAIPGYDYGSVARAPLNLADLDALKQSVLLGDDDVAALRRTRPVLEPQVDAILDVWYGFIGAHPFLLGTFAGSDGVPNSHYLASVRKRFGRWILDTADADYNQEWLDYQFAIGRRHFRSEKNRTDNVSAAEIVPFRYLFPVVYPVTATLKPFLAKAGHAPADVDAMHQAWIKSVLLQMTLWSYPYVREGDF